MILLYRITPFFVALLAMLGFSSVIFHWAHPLVAIGLTLIVFCLLMARLVKWHFSSFSFWFFVGTPLLFFIATFGMILLFENDLARISVAVLGISLLTLFVEYVFQYTHLPSKYQPFSLEYLTLVLNTLCFFFFASFGFAARILLQIPLSFISIAFFFLAIFLVYGTIWVAKSDVFPMTVSAFFGALFLTELFVVLSFLPVGFYTSAAFLTVGAYAFMGLTRAHAIHKLSRQLTERYLLVTGILLLFIGLSSQWL